MKTYKQEVKTILFALQGCPWAVHGGVQDVLVEYGHLQNAASTPTQSRRVSLQIFHAARAIDSFLGHIAGNECVKCGRPLPRYWTLGSSFTAIQTHGVSGKRFTTPTQTDVQSITTARNTYLHKANCFPSDQDMQRFINSTVRAIAEASKFLP